MATQFLNGLAVEVDGDGDAVLCIHGLGGSSNTWTPLRAALQGFKRVSPDLPASARSEVPDGTLSIQVYVDSMVKVLQALDLKSAHVVAHSMGTIVAQHLAVARPDLVKSLALFGPLVAPPDAARAGSLKRAELARSGPAAMQEIADAIVQAATSKETKEKRPAVLAAVRESVMRQPAEGYAKSCEALAAAQSAAIEQIAVPTLLVTGDQDAVAPVANVQAIAGRIQGSSLKVLDDCGHWPTFERPERCVEELLKFYAAIR